MLENMKPPTKINSCKVRTIMEELEPSDAKILHEALANREAWSHQSLSSALRSRGVLIGAETIGKHRRGECSC